MYHDETNFGFNKFGSNMHPQGARGFYFCKNGSWTPCMNQWRMLARKND